MSIWEQMSNDLADLRSADLYRDLRQLESGCGASVTLGGREVVCLCSNDYLALAGDEAVKSAAIDAIRAWGLGAGASRLVSGTTTLHAQLESRLARFKDAEAAVVTSTGWMANQVAIHALAGKGDLILCDKLDHASILDAALSSGASVRTYSHCDCRRLTALLERLRPKHRRCLIVTDSLFSMDGDLAPLADLAAIKKKYDAQLLIDEAHATGVLGPGGRGAAELLGVEDQIDATVGTLSKALGAMGGFVAGPRVLIETIINTSRSFIYTTAPPAALCAAALKSLEIIETQPQRRGRLLELSGYLRSRLDESRPQRQAAAAGVAAGPVTQIIPIVIGEPAEAVRISRALLDAGFLVPAIRPPTVPRGASRLRVSLCSSHRYEDLDRFVQALHDAG